jgi:predicted metal-dependent hydrolase
MEYKVEVIKSLRRSVVLTVKNGRIIVKAPVGFSDRKIKAFLDTKRSWIDKRLKEFEESKNVPKLTSEEIEKLRNETYNIVNDFADKYSKIIGVSFNKITVKKQRSIWGSCSTKRNLNFNLLLSLMPKEIIEYVVIHELCHLKEMNHSNKFWRLVKTYCKNCEYCKKWLKVEGNKMLNKI